MIDYTKFFKILLENWGTNPLREKVNKLKKDLVNKNDGTSFRGIVVFQKQCFLEGRPMRPGHCRSTVCYKAPSDVSSSPLPAAPPTDP